MIMKAKGMGRTKPNHVYVVYGISHIKLSGNGIAALVDTTGVIAEGRYELSEDGLVSLVDEGAQVDG
jgi:hypothetical protein